MYGIVIIMAIVWAVLACIGFAIDYKENKELKQYMRERK